MCGLTIIKRDGSIKFFAKKLQISQVNSIRPRCEGVELLKKRGRVCCCVKIF